MSQLFAFLRGAWEFKARFGRFYSNVKSQRAYAAGGRWAHRLTLNAFPRFADQQRWTKRRK